MDAFTIFLIALYFLILLVMMGITVLTVHNRPLPKRIRLWLGQDPTNPIGY